MHMKKLLLSLLVVLWSGSIFAQSDFRSGYFVNLKSDTTRGFIDYNSSSINEKRCTYKKSPKKPEVVFKPTELLGYGIDNMLIYQSFEVVFDNEPTTVFMEKILSGKIALYKYNNQFYVKKNESELILLTESSKDLKKFKNSKSLVDAFDALMTDKPELKKDIKKTKLEEGSLINLLNKYNSVIGGSRLRFQSDLPAIAFDFSINAGYTFSKISMNQTSSRIDYLNEPWELSYAPTAGLMMDISSPKKNKNLFVSLGASYFQASYVSYNQYEKIISQMNNSLSYSIKAIQIPFGAKYVLPLKTDALNFGLGGSIGFSFQNTSLHYQEEEFSTSVVETINRDFFNSNMQRGVWISTAYEKTLKSELLVFLEMKGEYSSSYANQISIGPEYYRLAESFHGQVINLYVLIGLKF